MKPLPVCFGFVMRRGIPAIQFSLKPNLIVVSIRNEF